jgi:large-conductance mechanosensitive channel
MGTITTFAVAIYIGMALSEFFKSMTKELVTPIIAAFIPGVRESVDKLVINIGPVKVNIGEVIGSTINLVVAYFVVYMTLPYIKEYAPISGGRR